MRGKKRKRVNRLFLIFLVNFIGFGLLLLAWLIVKDKDQFMKIKGLVDEDFLQYKKPSMFIICSHCSFKCDKEYGTQICQNCELANSKIIDIDNDKIVDRYINNQITKAIVFGGLEPFDTFDELFGLILSFRERTKDDIVIYTGYRNDEIEKEIDKLTIFENIIVKFGRYIPDQEKHYDSILGIMLASNNQYACKIS